MANDLATPAAPAPRPADEDLAGRLRLVVTRLARRLRQESHPILTPSLTVALASIERHGSLSPSELATAERIQRPTATRLVARLEAAGLVVREQDPSDRRVVRVRASEQGRKVLRAQRRRKSVFLARQLRRLSPEELAVLEEAAAILERLLEAEERRR